MILSTNPQRVHTFPIELRLSRKLENAEEGRKLAAMLEEIIENGLRGEGDIADLSMLEVISIADPICRHPQEGSLRHMTTDK
jgi:hypothetical protein|nr:hypothetical protein [Neorhizobium tomejilense]